MAEDRDDLHWLALHLFRHLGSRELPAVQAQRLSLWGYEALRLLRKTSLSQHELGDELGLDKTKIMRVVDELESAGHVTRESDLTDRRRWLVTPTTEGLTACRRAQRSLRAIDTELFAQLPAGIRGATRTGLRGLVDALRTSEPDA